ncbi:MAG: hypothetical protein NTY81_01220 [Candidatus Staskawiczbacteria bacterium]|nr:hypothetical protein [Candidatus Staskawiczbacteria bacterium]
MEDDFLTRLINEDDDFEDTNWDDDSDDDSDDVDDVDEEDEDDAPEEEV